MINQDLLDILACPQCKAALQPHGEEGLFCEKCMLLYEIHEMTFRSCSLIKQENLKKKPC